METNELKVEVTFVEPVLGGVPFDEKLLSEHVANGHEDEVATGPGSNGSEDTEETVEEEIKQKSTGFHRDEEGNPFIYDYVVKGFFKDACKMLRRIKGTDSHGFQAYQKKIDGLVFAYPRRIPLHMTNGDLQWIERPLRAQTPKGERICLARSEMAPAGTTVEFEVHFLDDEMGKLIEEWLDYGALRGFGPWRNASYGRFTWKVMQ